MAGNPEDMTVAPYKDTDFSHDHVYLGNGCSTGTGSVTPCPASDAGGRIVKTADNEDQKNGTYYNYQAATVGTGSAVTAQYTNTHDTFCPLGWQLPYGGTDGDYYNKSKSWVNFFTIYSLTNNRTSANKARSYPISIALGGRYYWGQDAGALFVKDDAGHFWSITLKSNIDAYKANVWLVGDLTPNLGYAKNNGLSIRCV